MTLGGWITFLLSTISVTSLFVWCILRILKSKREKSLHGILIETDDIDE